jgi:hypothetical protein
MNLNSPIRQLAIPLFLLRDSTRLGQRCRLVMNGKYKGFRFVEQGSGLGSVAPCWLGN